jgi:PTS system fructose-specific IIC component
MLIEDVLKPDDVHLSLAAQTKEGAVEEVLAKLNGDPRVKEWETLRTIVLSHPSAALANQGWGICIAHGRTSAVTDLVVAAGRSDKGVSDPLTAEPVRLVFVAGIPTTMSSEYLRVVGAIARVCRNEKDLEDLLLAKTGEAFVELLQSASDAM